MIHYSIYQARSKGKASKRTINVHCRAESTLYNLAFLLYNGYYFSLGGGGVLDVGEALRYLGASGADEELRRRTQAAAQEMERRFQPHYTYRISAVEHRDEGEWLADVQLLLPGASARKMLGECGHAALLVCTLGLTFEQHLRETQARDMARAVLLDALGSVMVEAGCDRAQEEIAARFPEKHLTDRFSPGYGDLPLTLQPEICRITDSRRRLGVYVTETCLLNPQKSVTAVIGLADQPQRARIRGCGHCAMRNTCELRKGGHSCDD